MCEDAPMPPCACFKAPPCCCRTATNSFRSFAGKSFRAITTAGEWAVMPIGTKSTSGSYLTFGVSTGAATSEPMAAAKRVYPSGAAAAARALPIVPPAPLTFSMMMDCPRVLDIWWLTMRATASLAPPGGKGTITVIDLDG